MWTIWGRQDPGGPHVGPMNFAIWGVLLLGFSAPLLITSLSIIMTSSNGNFLHYWPCVRRSHWPYLDPPHKGLVMQSLQSLCGFPTSYSTSSWDAMIPMWCHCNVYFMWVVTGMSARAMLYLEIFSFKCGFNRYPASKIDPLCVLKVHERI